MFWCVSLNAACADFPAERKSFIEAYLTLYSCSFSHSKDHNRNYNQILHLRQISTTRIGKHSFFYLPSPVILPLFKLVQFPNLPAVRNTVLELHSYHQQCQISNRYHFLFYTNRKINETGSCCLINIYRWPIHTPKGTNSKKRSETSPFIPDY